MGGNLIALLADTLVRRLARYCPAARLPFLKNIDWPTNLAWLPLRDRSAARTAGLLRGRADC